MIGIGSPVAGIGRVSRPGFGFVAAINPRSGISGNKAKPPSDLNSPRRLIILDMMSIGAVRAKIVH